MFLCSPLLLIIIFLSFVSQTQSLFFCFILLSVDLATLQRAPAPGKKGRILRFRAVAVVLDRDPVATVVASARMAETTGVDTMLTRCDKLGIGLLGVWILIAFACYSARQSCVSVS